ncbi:unnamed protein product [Gadus morhua 'NCC']
MACPPPSDRLEPAEGWSRCSSNRKTPGEQPTRSERGPPRFGPRQAGRRQRQTGNLRLKVRGCLFETQRRHETGILWLKVRGC